MDYEQRVIFVRNPDFSTLTIVIREDDPFSCQLGNISRVGSRDAVVVDAGVPVTQVILQDRDDVRHGRCAGR